MFHGIVNVYKEPGYTSFDVVAILRGVFKQKKIGHTGTLDPQAEGVLPVCLGNGTKLCELFTDKTKEYRCCLLLGKSTDTEDTTGNVLEEREVNANEASVREVISSFAGDYMQVPPMYSALKVNGKKMYELARQGIVIDRPAREVHIYEIEIEKVELPYVTMRVVCSKGTYIRSLCRDIGEKLGTLGCMEKLIRTRTGVFDIEHAYKIDEIKRLGEEGKLDSIMLPLEESLIDYPSITVKEDYKKKIDNGNPLDTQAFTEKIEPSHGDMYRVNNAEGIFFALYKYNAEKDLMMPEKIFPLDN